MNITMDQIKALRDKTGISVMQCKKALEESAGDMEKAEILLSKQSKAIASKKAERETGSGKVASLKDGGKAVLLTLYCETDFVAKNDVFKDTANKIAEIALEKGDPLIESEALPLIEPAIQKL